MMITTQKRYDSQRPMTTRFKDALGNQFDVMYEASTGNVIRLKFDETQGLFSTIVTRENSTGMWLATRVEKSFSQPHDTCSTADYGTNANLGLGSNAPARRRTRTMELVRPSEPIPVFTRVLADARFDARRKELTLASFRFTKRWVFRANGTVDFFSAEGHRSFA